MRESIVWETLYEDDGCRWRIVKQYRYRKPYVYSFPHNTKQPKHADRTLSYAAMAARYRRVKTYTILYLTEEEAFDLVFKYETNV